MTAPDPRAVTVNVGEDTFTSAEVEVGLYDGRKYHVLLLTREEATQIRDRLTDVLA